MVSQANKKNKLFFERVLKKNTLSHAYLFEGPVGSGKLDFALTLAQALFCVEKKETIQPCGQCYQCRRIEQGQHPDLIFIQADESSIKVDRIRELIDRLSKTAVENQGQLAIINEAEKMTPSAANALLKLLEEAEEQSLILLLTSAKNRILPTILSRCQILHFQAESIDKRVEHYQNEIQNSQLAKLLAFLTQDRKEAIDLASDPDFVSLVDKVDRFYSYMLDQSDRAYPFIQTNFACYKEKQDQQTILDLLLAFYRLALQESIQAEGQHKAQLSPSLIRLTSQLKKLLQALAMFQSHVPFQSALEYFYLSSRLDR